MAKAKKKKAESSNGVQAAVNAAVQAWQTGGAVKCAKDESKKE